QESFFDRAGLPELEVEPLDPGAAGHLVAECFPTLAPGVRDRILVEAQGNPVVLLGVPPWLTRAQRSGLQALPVALPVGGRLQALFASRIEQLPDSARELLLLMGLDGTGELRLLRTGAGDGGWLEQLAAAEQAGLAYIDEETRRPAFRHPLI